MWLLHLLVIKTSGMSIGYSRVKEWNKESKITVYSVGKKKELRDQKERIWHWIKQIA